MIPTSVAEVASAVGGRLTAGTDPDTVVTGPVTVDSRQVAPGALFVALPGERVDGHDYAAAAEARGAAAVLAARAIGVPSVLVDDPLAAVGLVARDVLDRLPRLHRRRGHRLVRQDQHQGPARRPAGPARSHRGPAGLVQQRARACR